MTSFLWGYAATKIMPRYQDKDTLISIQKTIDKNKISIDKLMEEKK
jgi:hypothetical protein